jgi:hypothetical protein
MELVLAVNYTLSSILPELCVNNNLEFMMLQRYFNAYSVSRLNK